MHISDELRQYVADNPQIDKVYFDRAGNHHFNVHKIGNKFYSRQRQAWEEDREDYEICDILTREMILEQELEELIDRDRKPKIRSIFHFEFLNYKFYSLMDAVLTVPSGTPVTGFNAAGDAKGNNLGDSRYKAGSCKYAVIPGPSGNPPGFTVAPGAREEAFVVIETTPGTASDGIITFDAQDSDGNPIPQSKGTLTFTQAPAKVTQNLFNFDQTSH